MNDGKWSASDYVPHAPDAVSALMCAVLLFACWTAYRTAAQTPSAPVTLAEHVCDENPWGFSLVIKPDGTYSYYVRDTEGELGKALVDDVLQDAAALHANTGR